MKKMSVSAAFLLALFAWAGPEQEEVKPVPNQAKVTEDDVYTTVHKLMAGQGNWIGQSDVIVDHEGFVWIKADAKVRSHAKAEYFGKEKAVQVSRTAKGHTVTVPVGDWEWEPVQRKDISVPVVPCMSWTREKDKEPLKSKNKGLGTFQNAKDGGQ